MSVEKIAAQHVSQYKELATAIGHAFIVNQVQTSLIYLCNQCKTLQLNMLLSKNIFNFCHISLQINNNKAFDEVAKALCETDRKALKTLLQLMTNDLQGSFEFNGLPKTGVAYKRAGAVAHILFCPPVNVTLREQDFCTHVSSLIFPKL